MACNEVVTSIGSEPEYPPGNHPEEADTVNIITYQPKLPDRFFLASVFRALLSSNKNDQVFETKLNTILNENIVYKPAHFMGACFLKKKRGDRIEQTDGCANSELDSNDDYLKVSATVSYVGILENVCKELYELDYLHTALSNSLNIDIENLAVSEILKMFEVLFQGKSMTPEEQEKMQDFIEQARDEDIENDAILKDAFYVLCKQEAWLLI